VALKHLFRRLALSIALAATAVGAAHAQQSVLKVVLDGEVQVLDPVATTNYRTRDFAYMVYDTLIAMDSKGVYRPQMLESFSASADRMTYTFKLRPGLVFSDGTPVTAEDSVASIQRWAKRDGLGRQLIARTKAVRAVDKDTFVIELAKPFGYVIEALGKPSSNILVVMPARLAALDPAKPVPEVLGSGPFTFRRDLWVPGSRMVLEKNPRYNPRPEPADGLAGGKRPLVDRIELITMPDPATKVAALQSGEVDFVQNVPFDFLPILRRARGITLDTQKGLGGFMVAARPNHLQPPFDNVKVRQALQAAIDQKAILAAIGASGDQGMECYSMFMCGAPYTSTAGTEQISKGQNLDRARQLLKEAGYKGEKIVVLHTSDIQTIHIPATVIEDSMRKAGFNVEAQASEWATVAQRRGSKEPTDKGGWSLLPIQWVGFDLESPFTHYGIAHNCTEGYAGWSCDEEMGKHYAAFIEETDPAKRKELIDKIQTRAHETVSVVLGGQYMVSNGYRSNVKGVLSVGIPVFWNVAK
jgi:peptide/nickel transport system substrate-binding protein